MWVFVADKRGQSYNLVHVGDSVRAFVKVCSESSLQQDTFLFSFLMSSFSVLHLFLDGFPSFLTAIRLGSTMKSEVHQARKQVVMIFVIDFQ